LKKPKNLLMLCGIGRCHLLTNGRTIPRTLSLPLLRTMSRDASGGGVGAGTAANEMTTRRLGTGDDGLDEAGNHARPGARRIPALYRVRELDAFAPSQREAVLREALSSTDRGWPFVRQCVVGILCAFLESALLLSQRENTVVMALAAAAAFCVSFLLIRRDNVRRRLRTRVARRRAEESRVVTIATSVRDRDEDGCPP